jgi:hypothetical protein
MLMIMQMKHGSRVQERIYRPMIHSTSCAQRARWLAEACAQAERSVRNRRSSTTRDVVIFCAYNASCLRGGVTHSPAKVRDRKRQERRAKTDRSKRGRQVSDRSRIGASNRFVVRKVMSDRKSARDVPKKEGACSPALSLSPSHFELEL